MFYLKSLLMFLGAILIFEFSLLVAVPTTGKTVSVIDPSELLRPEPKFASKPVSQYRDYSVKKDDPLKEKVRKLYMAKHSKQTVEFVERKMSSWLKFDKFKGTVMDALMKLKDIIDESDPDYAVPDISHAFQTAEQIRSEQPDLDWFHLVGLIHDLGKIMALYDEPQYAVVGDSFPVGCAWAKSIVYGVKSFKNNPDTKNSNYNTKNGIYKPNCGLENVKMSWGHDEYIYQVLKHNKNSLPEEALYIIRFHSFYPWHTGGDYGYLCNEKDLKMKDWVLKFNHYDLYTKGSPITDWEKLVPYYQSLIDKYIPGELEW